MRDYWLWLAHKFRVQLDNSQLEVTLKEYFNIVAIFHLIYRLKFHTPYIVFGSDASYAIYSSRRP